MLNHGANPFLAEDEENAWKAADAIANNTSELHPASTPEQIKDARVIKKLIEEYVKKVRPDLLPYLKKIKQDKRYE